MTIAVPRYQVPEYFLYDPTGDYLRPSLVGYRLQKGEYSRLMPDADGRLHSEQLNIELKEEAERLRLFVPESSQALATYAEARDRADAEAKARVNEAERANAERERANTEAERANNAEAEIARLRAELEALRQQGEAGKEVQA